MSLGEALLDFCGVGDARHDHAIIAVLPISGRGHLEVVGQLKRVDHAQNLAEVPAGAGRVGDGRADFFVAVDEMVITRRGAFMRNGKERNLEKNSCGKLT